MNERTMYKRLWDRLSADKAMVLLSGPRQAGKTTLAREIVSRDFKDTVYFNWDLSADKKRLMDDPLFFSKEPRSDRSSRPLVIFDEIHKYRNWKNYLKGIYDQFAREYQFLVTGSGRLEFSRKAGDSLAGRFLKFHIFPFTMAELSPSGISFPDFMKDPLAGIDKAAEGGGKKVLDALYELSGFPEPFIKGGKDFWRTWSSSYGEQIIRDDLRTVADIRNLDTLEILYALLPSRVGSPLSVNKLAGILQVAFDTVRNWLLLFDAFYLTFRLSPWTAKISRSILKEKKIYLFDFPLIEDEGARFENLVAIDLLRAVDNWNDRGRGKFRLHYVRNKKKEEVDFLLAERNRPFLLVETKAADERPSPSLMSFQSELNVPAIQLVRKENVGKFFKNGKNDILVVTAHQWLSALP